MRIWKLTCRDANGKKVEVNGLTEAEAKKEEEKLKAGGYSRIKVRKCRIKPDCCRFNHHQRRW